MFPHRQKSSLNNTDLLIDNFRADFPKLEDQKKVLIKCSMNQK